MRAHDFPVQVHKGLRGRMHMDANPTYLSFLLRLWQEKRNGETRWRASVESAQTAERRVFADLDELVAFLYESAGSEPTQPRAQ